MPLQKEYIDWAPLRESLARRNQQAAQEEQYRGAQGLAMGQQALQALLSSLSESEQAKRDRAQREFEMQVHTGDINARREEQNAQRAYDVAKWRGEQAQDKELKQAREKRLQAMQDDLVKEREYQRAAKQADLAVNAGYKNADLYWRQKQAEAAQVRARNAGRGGAQPQDREMKEAMDLIDNIVRAGTEESKGTARARTYGVVDGDAGLDQRIAAAGAAAERYRAIRRPDLAAMMDDVISKLRSQRTGSGTVMAPPQQQKPEWENEM